MFRYALVLAALLLDESTDSAQEDRGGPGVISAATSASTRAALNLMDIDAIVERIDLDALIDRIDVNALIARIDLDLLVERIDLDLLVERIDLTQLIIRAMTPDMTRVLLRGRASGNSSDASTRPETEALSE